MAFATSNLRSGVIGNKRYVMGTWTGAAGDAAGTFNIGSTDYMDATFYPNLATGTGEIPFVTSAVSGNQMTLSIHNKENVTNGKFVVRY